jgi:uncharacterized alpha/beta hydrolase family protein
MKKIYITIMILILIIILIFDFYKKVENPCKYICEGKREEIKLIFIKGFDKKDNDGCMVCAMKHENFSQWKRLINIYKDKIKVVGYYSKEWKDIISTYKINFKPMNSNVEERFGKYSSLTLICKNGKSIYKHEGEISIKDYREISEILKKEISLKFKE